MGGTLEGFTLSLALGVLGLALVAFGAWYVVGRRPRDGERRDRGDGGSGDGGGWGHAGGALGDPGGGHAGDGGGGDSGGAGGGDG